MSAVESPFHLSIDTGPAPVSAAPDPESAFEFTLDPPSTTSDSEAVPVSSHHRRRHRKRRRADYKRTVRNLWKNILMIILVIVFGVILGKLVVPMFAGDAPQPSQQSTE